MVIRFQLCQDWVEFWKTSERPTARRNDGQEEWVADGSVDLRGMRVLRRKTGGWKASVFIITNEFSERLAYFAIATNLIIYLTTVLHEELATSAKNVSYWVGVTCVMPLVGGFLADAYCGRYWMVLTSSLLYLSGLILLTLSASLSALKPRDHCDGGCGKATSTQTGVFYLALYLISLGTSGHKPSLQAFGTDQFDEEDKTEAIKKSSFFNFWYFGVLTGLLFAVTVVAYVQEKVSWGFGFGIITVVMTITTVIFLCGTPFYRHKLPGGSPITRILQVVVGAITKRTIDTPSDITLLYENLDVESIKSGQRLLSHTDNLQFLDKAAIIVRDSSERTTDTQGSVKPNPWKVCTVTQVEETKFIFRMVPIWLSCLTFTMTTLSQSTSFFIKQGSTMNRSIGSHFQVPAVSLAAFSSISGLVFVTIYDRFVVPLARRITGRERGLTVLQRIGIGMFFSVLCMTTAALTEKKRTHVAEIHGLLDRPNIPIPITVFWLTPQFVLVGIADVFALVALQEYFITEAPDSMRSLGIAFYLSVVGVSSFLNGLLITIVERVTKTRGHQGWLVNNLNRCKLHYFYWLLAALSAINLCLYVYIAHMYTYKKVKQTLSDTKVLCK